jgi:hypothetical protein
LLGRAYLSDHISDLYARHFGIIRALNKPRTATHRDPRGIESRVEVIKWLFPLSAAYLPKMLRLQ